MDIELIKEAINYYLEKTNVIPPYIPVVISIFALVIGAFTVYYTLRLAEIANEQYRHSKKNYLASVWDGILDTGAQNPRFLNINLTEKYYDEFHNVENLSYHAFCVKAWSYVEYVVLNDLHKDQNYKTKISWISGHHFSWLERNPEYFKSDAFWTVVKDANNEKPILFRHKKLPKKGADIDWDTVAEDY
jgi:hypothetical protein